MHGGVVLEDLASALPRAGYTGRQCRLCNPYIARADDVNPVMKLNETTIFSGSKYPDSTLRVWYGVRKTSNITL